MADPNALRCSHCDVDFPHLDRFRSCPVCRGETWEATSPNRLSIVQADAWVLEQRGLAEVRALRREAFANFYATLHKPCSLCGHAQSYLQPHDTLDAYAICDTCDRAGTLTIPTD